MKKIVSASTCGLVLAAVAGVAMASSNDSDGAADAASNPSEVHRLSGYPLDRGLDALVADADSENIILLESVESASPVDVTPKKTAESDSQPITVVTPVAGRITKVLKGDLKPGASPQIPVLGGTAGKLKVEASNELAPSLSSLTKAGTILVAGKTSTSSKLGGEFVDPSFIYRVDEDGTVTSLLESAGDEQYPTFRLSDLMKALGK